MSSLLLDQLMDALRCLPGVGPKTAQRMAYHLLERDRAGGLRLAETIQLALEKIGHCQSCRTFTEESLCQFCANPNRDRSLLCVVESPADQVAVEQATAYRGLYFVLMGRLSPLDGIGPAEIGMDLLQKRLDDNALEEVIIATSATLEGEATAHYITEMAHSKNITVTRIAHGVPIGGELEFVDGGTLSRAFSGRQKV